jgi:hypothetical protein
MDSVMNLYLDIDGVLLGKADIRSPEIRLALGAEDFLIFALARFDCFWLSTHCQGRTEGVLKYLAPYGPTEFMALAAKVKPTSFQAMKTEALEGDFLWLDDAPMQRELDWLSARGWLDRWIHVDTRHFPKDLRRVQGELEQWPDE